MEQRDTGGQPCSPFHAEPLKIFSTSGLLEFPERGNSAKGRNPALQMERKHMIPAHLFSLPAIEIEQKAH